MSTILIACEESQTVTFEFRKLGIKAYSCDILPCSGHNPEWHIQGDVRELLVHNWDLIIAFPPCTDLAVSGAKWFDEKKKDGRQQKAIDFFLEFTRTGAKRVAIENSIGIMSTHYRKPDQIIQPWMFGDSVTKGTCLWLDELPLLVPTKIVPKPEKVQYASGKRIDKWYTNLSKKQRSLYRSKTFPGIAKAMAEQWGKLL